MSKSAIESDFSRIDALEGRLDQLSGEDLQKAAAAAVNRVVDESYVLFKRAMTQGLTLTEQYVDAKMQTEKAVPASRVTAKIIAKRSVTLLGHYAPVVIMAPVKHPKRSKGHAAIAVPAGQKAVGASVEVSRGSRKALKPLGDTPDVVIWPSKRDREGNPMLFRLTGGRTSKGLPRMEALYGPAVYQLFRYQIDQLSDAVAVNLEQALVEEAVDLFERLYE